MLTQSNAGHLAGPSDDLELVNYGAGFAWLRRERAELDAAIADADRHDQDHDQLERDLARVLAGVASPDDRYDLTPRGRDLLSRWRAEVALFGRERTATPRSPRWVCSGRGPASQTACSFSTSSYTAASRHFKRTGHDVDEVSA